VHDASPASQLRSASDWVPRPLASHRRHHDNAAALALRAARARTADAARVAEGLAAAAARARRAFAVCIADMSHADVGAIRVRAPPTAGGDAGAGGGSVPLSPRAPEDRTSAATLGDVLDAAVAAGQPRGSVRPPQLVKSHKVVQLLTRVDDLLFGPSGAYGRYASYDPETAAVESGKLVQQRLAPGDSTGVLPVALAATESHGSPRHHHHHHRHHTNNAGIAESRLLPGPDAAPEDRMAAWVHTLADFERLRRASWQLLASSPAVPALAKGRALGGQPASAGSVMEGFFFLLIYFFVRFF
jgi:hypothetical protein